jgi:hypothetical protein
MESSNYGPKIHVLYCWNGKNIEIGGYWTVLKQKQWVKGIRRSKLKRLDMRFMMSWPWMPPLTTQGKSCCGNWFMIIGPEDNYSCKIVGWIRKDCLDMYQKLAQLQIFLIQQDCFGGFYLEYLISPTGTESETNHVIAKTLGQPECERAYVARSQRKKLCRVHTSLHCLTKNSDIISY